MSKRRREAEATDDADASSTPTPAPEVSDPVEASVPDTPDATPTKKDKKDKNAGKVDVSATSSDLEAFFSEIGPVKSCFVVAAGALTAADEAAMEKGPKVNKGFGFVTYAVAEDAQRALTELKDVKFNGERKLQLELAMKKSAPKEESKPAKPLVARKNPHPATVPKMKRPPSSVKIVNIKSDVTKKQLNHKVKKLGTLKELVYPVENDPEAKEGKFVAIAHYRSPADAEYAVKKLNDHIFKGDKIRASLFETAKSPASVDPVKEARKFRLIIRNLSFQVDNAHLEKAFKAFGTVNEVVIPVKPDGKKRGFGFVQMSTMEEAEAAMNGMNENKIQGREIAVDWALPKDLFELTKNDVAAEEGEDGVEVAAGAVETEGEGEDEIEGEGDEEEDDEDFEGEEGEDDDDDGDEGSVNDEDADGGVEYDEDGIKVTFDDADGDIEMGEDDDDEQAEIEAKKRRADHTDIDNYSTIFIRNLPFESTQEELNEKFVTFGPLKYAVVTKDPVTGRSRGTAFLNYKDPEDAKKVMIQYKEAEKSGLFDLNPAEAEKDKKKKKGKESKSILVPEPSLTAGSPFVMGGRFLNLTFAVRRDDAAKFMEENLLKRRANDKRNMYLLKEGMIFSKSDAAKGVPPVELEKRQKSYTERKRLLDTNPSLFISKTRLSVRNLGNKVTDAGLKRVLDEVAEGGRKGLEKEVVDEEIEEGREKPGPDRRITLKQVKIMKDKDQLDPKTNKPQSKGFGFIEFDSHGDALACLRWLNNNPLGFDADGRPLGGEEVKAALKDATKNGEGLNFKKSQRRPIVEFAVENRVVLRQRAERELKEKAKREEKVSEEVEEEGSEKKKRRKDRRKEAAERRKEAEAKEEGNGDEVTLQEKKGVKGDKLAKGTKGQADKPVNGKRKADDAEETVEPAPKASKKAKKGKKSQDDGDDDATLAANLDLDGTMMQLEALIASAEKAEGRQPPPQRDDDEDFELPVAKPKAKGKLDAKPTPPKQAKTPEPKPKAYAKSIEAKPSPQKAAKPTPQKAVAPPTPQKAAKSTPQKAVATPTIQKAVKRKADDNDEIPTPKSADKKAKKEKEVKPLTKAQKKDEKDEAEFLGLLKQYGKGLFGESAEKGKGKKKAEKIEGEDKGFKKWYT
ncbi:hypothetical protein BC829DRAFT_436603 [Chytridium lagenaria]|nr:hypothetical protein BC829DRAFT_436603 [Chytridium lagenaria]